MLSLMFIFGLICIGIIAGFASGLLGVGGGFLMVPLQFFLLTSNGLDSGLAMMVSLGTSLAIIIPTASSGAYKHQKEKKGIVKPGVTLGLFGIIGGFLGGILASYIPSNILQFIFAILLFLVAINMIYQLNKIEDEKIANYKLDFNLISAGLTGVCVGLLSGLLGIGGGVLLVPILASLFGFVMIEAIGISSVFISLTAIGGVLSYIYSGLTVNTLPYSLGYLSLVNFVVIVLFSVPLAYFGAKLAYKIPEKKLKQVFAIVLVYMAIKMFGFDPLMYLVNLI